MLRHFWFVKTNLINNVDVGWLLVSRRCAPPVVGWLVVGSHGLWVGEDAHGQENGKSGCWLLVLMGYGLGKMPMVRKTGEALLVVGSHGLWIGEDAHGSENGKSGCWLLVG